MIRLGRLLLSPWLLPRMPPLLAGLLAGLMACLAPPPLRAAPLAYEPVGLGWTAEEVERAGRGALEVLLERAQLAGRLGCQRHCERLARMFAQLVTQAQAQQLHSGSGLRWTLIVVRLDDVEAFALPGGQVIIGETFADQLGSEATLAFVLAHEMAHSILEHERQALTFARQLLPREVPRSVRDMYTEMEFNIGLVRAMEPVLHQGEFEADELGLILAASAGYDPLRQLGLLEQEAAEEPAQTRRIVSTHPSARERLARLRALLPLARRQMPLPAGP
ncbi:MAG: M48 family metalloprotease [Burkholderiales bacterium]|jgi:predicted Zn-dependent protease|nr:M48 family metalloprotease [Burkholderiales bacterium]MBP7522582.1 M48 family metalloprotease [Leptothrix sp. (in: b-proteobacteria)]